ncbi:MAG: hypothetical protein EP330_01290 [Deltaproteobacteria bacterium]|nr:MAG: hypothetical protein EP330_01290 [Deltaproteobacteria bacterium]
MNSEGLRPPRAIRLALCLAGCAVGADALAAPMHLTEAWLTVESLAVLSRVEATHPLLVDHGRERAPDGSIRVRILAAEPALDAIEADGFAVQRLPSPRRETDGGYSSPEQGAALLRSHVAASPRAGLVQLGESVEGRPLLAAWFGQSPDSTAPDLRVLGAHHGDEWSSFEVALDLAELLATADGTRTDVTTLLDRSTVWVAPYINPDGVRYGTRQNANDVDLNRNYEFQWRESGFMTGDGPFSEPETRAVRAHALTTAPPLSLSLHSGAANIGYVWNYSYTEVPELDVIDALARRYAAACTRPNFWVTNGADWYRSWGDTNDWSYGRYGGMDFTVELTVTKTPASSEIPTYVADHREAVLAFLTAELPLAGTVRDANSGRPIPATLTLAGTRESRPFLTGPDGGFARHGPVDDSELVVSAPGYASQRVALASAEVSLVPQTLSSALSAPGRILAGDEVELEGLAEGFATLSQPGHPSVEVGVTAERFTAPELAGGAWTVEGADGTVFPRVLLVEGDGPASRTDATDASGVLTLTGDGFAEGTRAWALVGDERAWLELPVQSESATRIDLDLGSLDPGGDFLTLTNGTWLVHTRRTEGPGPRDTGTPTDSGDTDETGLVDTGPGEDTGDEPVRPACGCATGTAPLGLIGFLPLLVLRRTRS